MSNRKRWLLVFAMSVCMLLMVMLSFVAGSIARQVWEEAQWEMAGIFAVAAAVSLAFTALLGYLTVSVLRKKEVKHDDASAPECGRD